MDVPRATPAVKQTALAMLAAGRDWINISLTEKEICLALGAGDQRGAHSIDRDDRGE